jgi:hypothetical protein
LPQDKLTLALNELDKLLTARSLKIEIAICGAYAIQLHGITRGLHTLDVDSLLHIDNANIIAIIAKVGENLGLGPKWLNDQASTVSLPDGIFDRLTPIKKWSAIQASLISRKDLIIMKASAFSIRREHTSKDWEDLLLLSPTPAEIESAIEFIKQKNSPPANSSKIIKLQFEETLSDLKKLIT